jgi:hypothetical protein
VPAHLPKEIILQAICCFILPFLSLTPLQELLGQ